MRLPNDFNVLTTSGLLKRLRDSSDPLVVWDADFTTVDPLGFMRLDDQVVDIYPFAENSAGDYWGYVADRLPESSIYLFYRDSYEAEAFASTVGEFIFRQAITLSCVENLSGGDWTIDTAQAYVEQTATVFSAFFTKEMQIELERVCSATPTVIDDWTSLITEQEAEAIIQSCVKVHEEVLDWRG